jgi:serine/threonine-protein kinase
MPKRKSTFKLGRYEVLGRIAVGGMATVYRARLPGAGGFAREFALKVIHPHLSQVPGFTDRFLDEARVASRVRHPNCVATIDVDEDHGYQYLVLELIDGLTLRQLALQRDRQLAPDEAARVVADAARGLHAVHQVADEDGRQLDVIHRDLSPHNLMLSVRGRTILIDLGLAKARGQVGHTQTGVLAGKLPYMSPEQSRLETLDARSDVFSLGTVLYELVTGQLPFGEDHTPGTLERLRKCDRVRLATQLERENVPKWIAEIILACHHARPEDRFESALALAEALEQELHRNGRDDGEIRRRLALYAEDAKAALGPEQPPEELVPIIESAPDETASQGSRSRLWLGLAGAAAVAIAVVYLGRADPDTATAGANAAPGPSLSADAVPDEDPVPRPARTRTPALQPPPPTDESTGTPEETAETEAAPEPAPDEGQTQRRKRKNRRPKLKANPYTADAERDP